MNISLGNHTFCWHDVVASWRGHFKALEAGVGLSYIETAVASETDQKVSCEGKVMKFDVKLLLIKPNRSTPWHRNLELRVQPFGDRAD